jgi:ABC-type transport system involved in multi-copper enzyme maturation permease subunit
MMISKTAQLVAVTRSEFRLQWRQHAMLIATVVIFLVCLFMESQMRSTNDLLTDASYDAKVEFSTVLLASFQSVLHIFAILLIPIIVADSIPKDRQYRVRELLNTYPLSDEVYLAGKILGVWCNVLLCLLVLCVAIGISWWVIVHPFTIGDYVTIWLLGILPVALFNSALSVLIAASQPSRRRAVLLGVAFAIICLFIMGAGMGRTIGTLDVWNPGRPLALKYYLLNFSTKGTARAVFDLVSLSHLILSIGAAAIELLLTGGLVYWWMRRQEIH